MLPYRIGVIGAGVVGSAIIRTFSEWVKEIRVYDKDPKKGTHSLYETVEGSALTFLCLPTPTMAGGRKYDTYAIDEVLGKLHGSNRGLVLKSTVAPGQTDAFRTTYQLPSLIHSAEFLTARCASLDSSFPSRTVIGGSGSWAANLLHEICYTRFPGAPVIRCSNVESEAIKLVTNGFFAAKIAFFNEMAEMCHSIGATWGKVWEGVLSDGRIAPQHTMVPGPDGKVGFGGSCLPKDAAVLAAFSGSLIVGAALERNKKDRPNDR